MCPDTKSTLTFDMVCKERSKAHKTEVKPQSFHRLMTNYKRFIPKCSFAKKPIKSILDKIKEWNTTHKLKSNFIFVNASNHNFNRQRINTCLYSYCEKVDIIKKSEVLKNQHFQSFFYEK